MSVKGDIVFVRQAHAAQAVAAIVMDVPKKEERDEEVEDNEDSENETQKQDDRDELVVHIISSSDPYALSTVKHREYADDSGYLASDEDEPTENRPEEEKEGYVPPDEPEIGEGQDDKPNPENTEPGFLRNYQDTDLMTGKTDQPLRADKGEPTKNQPGNEDQDRVEGTDTDDFDEEETDESETDEEAEEASEDESDGKPVPPSRGKRGKGSRR